MQRQQNYQEQMQQRELTKSEQKINKMNSSMLAFRSLIESLRQKNKKQVKPSTSDNNPQLQSQIQSRLCASENIINVPTKIQATSVFIHSGTPALSEDQGIKLKSRGNVAGRDILNKKPSLISSQKFNQTVVNNKQHARNKNLTLNAFVLQNNQTQYQALEHIKLIIKKHSNVSSQQKKSKSQLQSFVGQDKNSLNKTSTTMPLSKPKVQQNKLNLKAIASRNKIKDIDENIIIKYCREAKKLKTNSQAEEIFDYFQGLMNAANVAIMNPFIKKFKNCIYFGYPVLEDDTYEGFLYFYENKIYFGQFIRNQKNGKGVEILLQDQSIYKGIFKEGQKTGKFWVKKIDQNYIGFLQKGQYHGQGKIQTKQSIYQGQFENGEKHGFGEQFFVKTGVRMVGYFDHGIFSKRSRSSFSNSEIEKGFKFKVTSKNNTSAYHTKNKMPHNFNLNQTENESEFDKFKHQNQLDLYTPPFSISSNNFNYKKTPFNKQKIRSFLPRANNKYMQPMPENCKDYDYSFDVSSRKDTQNFAHVGYTNSQNKFRQPQRGTISQFSKIQQQQQYSQHLDTSALQQPLPMPCFYKK